MKKFFIPPVFLFIHIAGIIAFYFFIPSANIISFPFNLFGLVFIFIGFFIVASAKNELNKKKTPHTFKKPIDLVKKGIFSKSRNPMYLGMVLFLTGIFICFQNISALIFPFSFFLIIHLIFIPFEEKILDEIFSTKFMEYKKQVRKWV